VGNEWLHLIAVAALGLLIHRVERRLDLLEALAMDVARIKTKLGMR
jgi:hypothetical protein